MINPLHLQPRIAGNLCHCWCDFRRPGREARGPVGRWTPRAGVLQGARSCTGQLEGIIEFPSFGAIVIPTLPCERLFEALGLFGGENPLGLLKKRGESRSSSFSPILWFGRPSRSWCPP
jgi:hypothetical protein